MSVFAKIFIVINLVLSVVFLTVSSTVLTQRADYKRQLEEQVQKNTELEAKGKRREEDLTTRNLNLQEDIKSYQSQTESLLREISTLRGENLKLAKKFDQQHLLFQALNGSFQSQTRMIEAITQQNSNLNQVLALEDNKLSEFKDAMHRAKNQAYAAMATNQGLQGQLRDKDQQISDLDEQLNEFKSKIDHLKDLGIKVEELTQVKVPPPLDGKVVAFNEEVNLVMVNLGAKQGVEKGMIFTVHRGSTYVGQIVVEQVYPDMASARIDPRFENEQTREGDDVTTRIR